MLDFIPTTFYFVDTLPLFYFAPGPFITFGIL